MGGDLGSNFFGSKDNGGKSGLKNRLKYPGQGTSNTFWEGTSPKGTSFPEKRKGHRNGPVCSAEENNASATYERN